LNDIVKSKYFLAQNKKLRSYFGVYSIFEGARTSRGGFS
jgi:hypothetical protein